MNEHDEVDASEWSDADDTVFLATPKLYHEDVSTLLLRHFNETDVPMEVGVQGTTENDSTHRDRERQPDWKLPQELPYGGTLDAGENDFDEIESPVWHFMRVKITPVEEPPSEGQFKLGALRRFEGGR